MRINTYTKKYLKHVFQYFINKIKKTLVYYLEREFGGCTKSSNLIYGNRKYVKKSTKGNWAKTEYH